MIDLFLGFTIMGVIGGLAGLIVGYFIGLDTGWHQCRTYERTQRIR